MMMKFSEGNWDGIVVEDKKGPNKLSKTSKKWSKEADLGKSLMTLMKIKWKDAKKLEGCMASQGESMPGTAACGKALSKEGFGSYDKLNDSLVARTEKRIYCFYERYV